MNRFIQDYKSFIQILILLAISAILVYFIPAIFNRILFLLFLIPIWKSKRDYFWYAFLFVLLDYPGGLFSGRGLENMFRLPIYTLAPQLSFSFEEICIFAFLFKGIARGKWKYYRSFVFKKQYGALSLILIFLLVIALLQGAEFASMRKAYKTLILISLYISSIFLFSKEDDIIEFLKTLFPFAFVALLLQLYGLVYHQQLVALFEPGTILAQGVLDPNAFVRPIELAVVNLLCFFGSLLYLDNKKRYFSNKYLMIVNASSYISIFMTATRSWFIGMTFMYLLYFALNAKKMFVNIKNYSIGILAVIVIFSLSPTFKKQADRSATRLQTIEMLYRGDLTAGNTLDRFTKKGPRVLEGFSKSTIIFGAGFSDLFYEYANGHVGFHNILLNSGVIGFIGLMGFAILLMTRPYRIVNQISISSHIKPILRNLPMLMPTLLIINSSTQFWGFTVDEPQRVMLLSLYICITSFYINEYKKADYNLKLNKRNP